MGPITQIDSVATTRVAAVPPVRGVTAAAPAAEKDSPGGRETVRLSARATETATREREQRGRETGDLEIDQELAGEAAVRTVTYSFYEKAAPAGDPQSQQAQSVSDRQRVREALSYYASVADVQFVEVRGGGDVQYGVTPAPSPAALRAAEAETQARADAAKAEASASEAAEAQADAAAAQADTRTAQTDDVVGLNPNDPDGHGGQATTA